VVEAGAVSREGVNVRGLYLFIAVTAEVIGTQCVNGDHDHIGSRLVSGNGGNRGKDNISD
jgi:hypothetical protein